MPNISTFFNLLLFLVSASTNAAIPVEPPDFGKLPVHPQSCKWTMLDYLGIAMLGCIGTGVLLACYFCQRKLSCLYDAN